MSSLFLPSLVELPAFGRNPLLCGERHTVEVQQFRHSLRRYLPSRASPHTKVSCLSWVAVSIHERTLHSHMRRAGSTHQISQTWTEKNEIVAPLAARKPPQALLSSTGPGPSGGFPLPQALLDAMPDVSTATTSTTGPTTSTTAGSGPSSTTAQGSFLPNLLLVLQSPTHVSPAEAEGGPGWLDMAIMGALDEFEAVPPAIISCVPPPSSLSSSEEEVSSSTPPVSTFDAALLDTPLSEVWRREATRHFE